MPCHGFADGLYLTKQQSPDKVGVEHYGIVDIGNRTSCLGVDGVYPMVFHQTPPSIRINYLFETGSWEVLGKIADERMAIARMNAALANPRYYLLGHNCEHFARYVATGVHESRQLQLAAVIGVTALVLLRCARR